MSEVFSPKVGKEYLLKKGKLQKNVFKKIKINRLKSNMSLTMFYEGLFPYHPLVHCLQTILDLETRQCNLLEVYVK